MCFKRYILILLILFCISFVLNQSTEGICNCDLSNSCDLLCCCDNDCLSQDLEAFNCRQKEPQSTYCVDELNNEIISTNTMFIFKDIKELICIVKKDYLYLSQPNDLKPLTEQVLIEKSEKVNPSNVFSTLDILDLTNREKEYFTSTDRIWLSFPDNHITYFKIPNQIGPKCSESLPINYLINQKTSCFSNDSANFNLTKYSELKVIPSIAIWKECNKKNLTDFYQCDSLVSLSTKMDSCIGLSIEDCLKKFSSIRKIKFIYEYLNPNGIINVYIDIDDSKSDVILNQNFEVVFVKTDQYKLVRKSGNPGYQIDEPIIAGTEKNDSIIISPNRDKWFAILPSTQYCNEGTKTTVLFGKNVLSECFFKIQKPANEICISSFNEYIRDLILDEYVELTHVAAYGSMIETSSKENEWIKIESTELPKPELTDGICNNLINELNLAISFALVGNVDNPQAKILNLKYIWDTTKIKISSNQNFKKNWLTKIRITFIDLTLNAEYTQSRLKRIKSKLSSDFFKPFN